MKRTPAALRPGPMHEGNAGRFVVRAVLGERGFDPSLGKMGEREIEQMIASLAQLEIDVNDGEETVRVYCE